jgi:eukaryotic-like serine/threonine-protein kinase
MRSRCLSENRDEKIEPKTEPKRRIGGRFELERKLGVGGMGVVYLATYLKDGRKMALKVLAPEMSSDQRLVRRFLREMSILSKLRHEHIVRYYGGGKDKTQHFYAMEYMNGGSVEQLLKKKGRLPWEEVIEFARQIAQALEYAHNRGIIHRDLKPANLFLSKEKGLKLGDFGIARDTQATALTAAGRTVGTYAYMAPEQIAGKPPVSRKTDIYALGCVMFEMLTGKPPFDAPTAAEMLFAHLEQEPPRVSSTALDCPVWLENIVQKCLEKDPEERFYDALALQVALDEVGPKVAAQQSAAAKTAGAAGATIKDPSELRSAVSTILGKKKKKKKKNRGPFYQRGWFLSTCLLGLISAVTWAAWPKSAEALWAKAERAREARDLVGAKDVYTQIVNRFPKGDLAEMCRQRIDDIDMELAESEAQNRRRFNREPRSEPQRVYMEVLPYIKLGDCATALQKLRSMVELQKGREDDPVYVNLARRRIAEIEESGCKRSDLVSFVNEKLQEADNLAGKGDAVGANVIWNGILDLYGTKTELERQVKYARARLGSSGEKIEPPYELVKKRQTEPPADHGAVKEKQSPEQKGTGEGKTTTAPTADQGAVKEKPPQDKVPMKEKQ